MAAGFLFDTEGRPGRVAIPYLFDVAEGNIPGHQTRRRIGSNLDVDAAIEDVWTVGGTYVFPAAGFGNTVIGRAGSYGGLYWNGEVGEVAIYNRVLVVSEALEYYRMTAGRYK